MKRYENTDNTHKPSRRELNQDLYNSLNDTNSFTSYTDVNNSNQYVLDATNKSYRTREGYQKLKEYGDLVQKPKIKKELDDFTNLYKETENKVYDINSVIEEAKKNRKKRDIEEKRSLKNSSYNILTSMTDEKLEEYRKNRKRVVRADEDDIKEILNTITTKVVNGEIDQATSVNLLSDLMATQQLDMVDGINIEGENSSSDNKSFIEENDDNEKEEEKNNDVLNKEDLKLVEEKKKISDEKDKEYEEKNQSKNIFKDMDQSFYTRSMDLSDKDFDIDNEEEEKKKKHPVLKFIFTLIILAILAVATYYVLKKFNYI